MFIFAFQFICIIAQIIAPPILADTVVALGKPYFIIYFLRRLLEMILMLLLNMILLWLLMMILVLLLEMILLLVLQMAIIFDVIL